MARKKKKYIMFDLVTTEDIHRLCDTRRDYLKGEYKDSSFAWKWIFMRELKETIGTKKFRKMTTEQCQEIEKTVIQNETKLSAFYDYITAKFDGSLVCH